MLVEGHRKFVVNYTAFGMIMPEKEYQSGMNTNCQSYKDTCTLTDAFCDFESVFKYKAFSFYNNDIRWLPLLSTQRNIDTFTYNGSRMLKMKTEHTDSGLYVYADDTLQPNKAYTVEWEQYRFGGATTVGYVVFYYNGSSWVTLASGTNNSDGIKSTSFNTTGYTLHRLRFYMTTSPAVGKYVLFDNIKFSYADSCMVTPCCETSMQDVVSAPLNNSFNAATKVGNEVYDGGQRWYPYQPYRTNIDTFTYSGSRKLKISADSIAFYAGAEITVPRGKMCTLSFEQYLFGGATVGEARLYYKVGSDWISYTNSPMTGNGTHTVTFTSPPYTTEHRILLYVKTGYGAGSYMLIDNLKLSYPDSIETLNCTGVADGLANGRNSYRYGFGNQEKVNEIAGEGNHYTSEFWEYSPRIGRRWNLDPVDQISISNYAAFRNNPIYYIDPNGARSFPSYYAYKRYAKANNLEVVKEADIWRQGHWLNSDVQYKLLDFGKPTFNDRYKNAARVNINNNASGEYRDLNERRELYDISDQFSKSRGSEVRWMNAAEKTVSTLNWALSPGAELFGKSNGEIRDFINAGNKAILDDMMPRINSLLSGSPITGNNAVKWDAQTLADEQNLIQPFYESLSQESRGILQKNLESAYGFKGDVMNAGDRWSLGMQMMGYKNATSDKMPTGGGDYQNVDLKGIKK